MNKLNKKLLIVISFIITLLIIAGLSVLFFIAFSMPYSIILFASAGVAVGRVHNICFENIIED